MITWLHDYISNVDFNIQGDSSFLRTGAATPRPPARRGRPLHGEVLLYAAFSVHQSRDGQRTNVDIFKATAEQRKSLPLAPVDECERASARAHVHGARVEETGVMSYNEEHGGLSASITDTRFTDNVN